jgi:hypothetical protein
VASTTSDNANVRLVSEPSAEELSRYWEARQSDPLVPVFYASTGPRTFADFTSTIASGGYVFRLAFRGPELIGAIWLHDIEYDENGSVADAWIGAYVLPHVRGRHLVRAMWDLFRPECESMGAIHIHGGTRKDNDRGYRVAHAQMDLHDVAIFPQFTTFEGVLHDCYIFTLQRGDEERAWRIAQLRRMRVQEATTI